MNSIQQFNKT